MQTKEIADLINAAGGTMYLVGGAVRDKIMKRENHDEDFVVTGIESDKFCEIFPQSFRRGKSFEVFDLDGREIALARKESKAGIGHKEFVIQTNPNITIEEDLARRDITINAIAENVLTGEIIDPFNGIEDIKNKVIRKTTNHFREDPLRVYRAARFAAELEFKVSEDTILEMKLLKDELKSLSSERVFTEFNKALLTKKPSIFFEVLRKADVLEEHFKEVKNLIGVLQPQIYHPEGDAYNHTMLVLDMAADLTKNYNKERKAEIRFSALVHDFGKTLTPKEEYPHHYGHEVNGVKIIEQFSKRLKVPNRFLKCGKTASLEHMRGGIFNKMKSSTKVEFIERIDRSVLGLDGLQIVVYSDKLSGGRGNKSDEINFEEIGKKCINEVNGSYIKNKYNLEEGLALKNKLHEERVLWMKNIIK